PIKRLADRSVQRAPDDSVSASPSPPAEAEGGSAQGLSPSGVLAPTTDRVMPTASLQPTVNLARATVSDAEESPRLELPLARRSAANEPSAQRAASVDDVPPIATAVPVEPAPSASPNPPTDASTVSPAGLQRLAEPNGVRPPPGDRGPAPP